MLVKSNQRGITFLSLLIVLSLIGFFALIILKVTPLYLQNSTVNSALDSLAADTKIGKMGKRAMQNKIANYFLINDVKVINSKDIEFEKSKEKKVWNVSANYEARTILFKNVGVFVDFQKTVEVPR